jgi:flavin-dependent dehydrogenase
MYDLIIIGAGLSGLSTALSCHSENLSILILEKGNLPRHKVCGEYLSAEVIPLLERWKIDVTNRPVVSRALLSAPNGSHRELRLPLGGIGVSRYFLDAALYQASRQREIEIHLHEGVRNVQENKDCFVVETKQQVYESKWVVSCHGKSSGSHIGTGLPDEKQVYLGVKQYYKIDFPKDLVALHTFKGGYGGAVLVENGWVDMAFMIQQDIFSEYKNIQRVMEAVLFQNPWMKRLLTHGEAMWKQPMAVSNFQLGIKHRGAERIFRAGDAAAMIPPASGNGMAMALLSGVILGRNIRIGFQKSKTREQIQQAYQKEWKAFFSNRLWWGQRIQWIMENPVRANAAMKIMKISDQLFRGTIRKTHGSPERVKELL